MKIKRILICGGGTSGWLTAAYLSQNLPSSVEISLIESLDIGPIGVGEGTQPYTIQFLRDAGLKPEDWMKHAEASYKLGVEFVGWTDNNYFVDNDSSKTHHVTRDLYLHKYWIGKDPKVLADWLPSYRFARSNLSPKLTPDLDYVMGLTKPAWEAVHFNAYAIVDSIKKKIKHKIIYREGKIASVLADSQGISKIRLLDGTTLTADLYIDCTGFNSLLLEKTLGESFHSVEDILPCNKAVAIPTMYKDPYKENHPYTKATAMEAGWRWTIPTYRRIGNGYVYSSWYKTPAEAEKELRDAIGEHYAEARHLNMKCGYHTKIARQNVIAIGLAAGFVEPLEATGITFTTAVVEYLSHYLNSFDMEFNDTVKNSISSAFVTMFDEIISFVWLHYHTSTKRDTEFWKQFDKMPVPTNVQKVLDRFYPVPPDNLTDFGHYNMFHAGQWMEMLVANGMFVNAPAQLSKEQELYCRIHMEVMDKKVEKMLEVFPNHHEYLSKWYDSF